MNDLNNTPNEQSPLKIITESNPTQNELPPLNNINSPTNISDEKNLMKQKAIAMLKVKTKRADEDMNIEDEKDAKKRAPEEENALIAQNLIYSETLLTPSNTPVPEFNNNKNSALISSISKDQAIHSAILNIERINEKLERGAESMNIINNVNNENEAPLKELEQGQEQQDEDVKMNEGDNINDINVINNTNKKETMDADTNNPFTTPEPVNVYVNVNVKNVTEEVTEIKATETENLVNPVNVFNPGNEVIPVTPVNVVHPNNNNVSNNINPIHILPNETPHKAAAKKISFTEAKKEIEEFTLQINKMEEEIKSKYGVNLSEFYFEDLLPEELKMKLVEDFFNSDEITELAKKAAS